MQDELISREAVNALYDKWRPRLATHVSEFGDELKSLPSVQPSHTQMVDKSNFDIRQYRADLDSAYECGKASIQPSRKGNWIAVYQGDEIINYRCSECELGDTNGSTDLYGWDYCRRCGADMKENEVSE